MERSSRADRVVPIDHAARRSLAIEEIVGELGEAERGVRFTLVTNDGDTRSAYHRALVRELRFRSGQQESRLDPLTERVVVPRDADVAAGGVTVVLGTTLLMTWRAGASTRSSVLSPFEVRFLADNGVPHGGARGERFSSLTTDLHTHFAGCVSGEGLVATGLELGLAYPVSLLAECGIRSDDQGRGDGTVRLDALTDALRARLAASLAVPLDRRVPFVEMERIYRLRAPITKSRAAFVPLCRRIADDYAAMGVRHVELSLSNVVEAAWLEAIHRELPAIEERSGVTMRFLAALSRHDDLEWDLDLLERFREIARSRYFVGVDFMGHETNSTRAFARQLREIAAWADRDRPGFVIRVHAGENPAYPENVRVAAECVAGRDVRLRVGHGLYGVDERTEALLREVRAIVELNLSSNLGLNNIQSAVDVPLRRYVDAGLDVVLGTDGYGIYGTTLELEAQAAQIAGLDASGLARVVATEAAYLEERERRDRAVTVVASAFQVPPDRPATHFTPEVPRRKERERLRRRAELEARLGALGIPLLDGASLSALLADKLVVSIAGSWRESWKRVSEAQRVAVRSLLASLFDGLAVERAVLVTGGTTWGVEHEAQAAARARGLTVLAAMVDETEPDAISGDVTHAWIAAVNLHAKAAGLYELMRRVEGLSLFIGGGGIVADEIQTASNLRLRYLVMDGPEGASTDHAARHPSRAFRSARDVLERLSVRRWPKTNDPFWHPGPNPTVDVVLFRESPTTGERELLLVRRDETASSEAGKWALPGGFQLTDAPRGAAWAPGRETVREALVRLLERETGLDVADVAPSFVPIGEYEGEGRDPRDTAEAWSRSVALAATLPESHAKRPIAGGHDASDARWWPVSALPQPLAFDHDRILVDASAQRRAPTGAP